MANDKEKEVRFELAESYFCINSKGEHLTFRCIKRTNKIATFKDVHYDKVVRVGLYANDKGVEYCYPLGRYTSKPVLFSDNKVNK